MLKLTQLALRRGPKLLLEDVNLQIHPGQKVGITGANGSGKSSLFSLILGEIGADAGDLRFPRDWVVAHVAQETPSDPRPAIEYVLDGDAELRRAEQQIAMAEARGDGETLAHLHGDFELIDGYTARSRAAQLLHGLGFTTADEPGNKKSLTVQLKYYEGRPVIERIQRVSSPGLRIFRSKDELPKVQGGLGIAVVSTSKGVMSDRAARAAGHGGEVLCVVN